MPIVFLIIMPVVNELEEYKDGTVPSGLQVQNRGKRIDQLGIGDWVIDCLVLNMPWTKMRDTINNNLAQNGIEQYISEGDLMLWWSRQPPSYQEAVRQRQIDLVLMEAWDFERSAIADRRKLQAILLKLIPEDDTDLFDLPVGHKENIIHAIEGYRRLMESGEKFMGVGSLSGSGFDPNKDEQEELLERIKDILKSSDAKPVEDLVDNSSYVDIDFNESEETDDDDTDSPEIDLNL